MDHERTEDNTRPRRGPRGARRRPRRPGRREGPHPGVPGRAQPAREPRPARRRRSWLGCGAGTGRPARGRQDQSRRVGGASARPEVRPGLARRHPGRSGDPRTPAYVRRCTARPRRTSHPRGRFDEPGRAPGRDRQVLGGLCRRPGRGPARGAGPGAEPYVPGPLPGGRPGPVGRAVPGDGERRGEHPRPVAGPHGTRRARRIHRGRKGRHRP